MSTPVGGPSANERVAIRRCALAVSVLSDLDIRPAEGGIVLPGLPEIFVSDDELCTAVAGADPETGRARRRLGRWLVARRAVAERSLDELAETIRPVGLPIDHELHPGPAWVREPVLGGCLDLGAGFVGLDEDDRDRVVVVPQSVLDATGVDPTPWWRGATEYLENMGALATTRWRRAPSVALRPMGDCDVVTLLGSMTLRAAIVDDQADGMRAVAVPMRSRGWLDLTRVDPAFSAAAARLTAPDERGFSRPLLVTREEVALAPEGGDTVRPVIEDRIAPVIDLRDVLYHRM